MSAQTDTEVFLLTEEYKRLEEERAEHQTNFDLIVESFKEPVPGGVVTDDSVAEIILMNPGRVKQFKVYTQFLLAGLKHRMDEIDARKVKLDELIIYANDAVDYPPA